MKIRLAEKSEAEAISRFVSELTVTHIGPTLQAGGLENLLSTMDVDSTITRMTEWIPALGRPIGAELLEAKNDPTRTVPGN
jgi:hypothetical protein